jgi:hypothetical protein
MNRGTEDAEPAHWPGVNSRRDHAETIEPLGMELEGFFLGDSKSPQLDPSA